MTITADDDGHVKVDTVGPIAGKAGALALLAEVRRLVELMPDAPG